MSQRKPRCVRWPHTWTPAGAHQHDNRVLTTRLLVINTAPVTTGGRWRVTCVDGANVRPRFLAPFGYSGKSCQWNERVDYPVLFRFRGVHGYRMTLLISTQALGDNFSSCSQLYPPLSSALWCVSAYVCLCACLRDCYRLHTYTNINTVLIMMDVSAFILFVKIAVTLLLHPSPSLSTPPVLPLSRFHPPPTLLYFLSFFFLSLQRSLASFASLLFIYFWNPAKSVCIERKQYKNAVITRECSTSDLQYHSDSDTSKQCRITGIIYLVVSPVLPHVCHRWQCL